MIKQPLLLAFAAVSLHTTLLPAQPLGLLGSGSKPTITDQWDAIAKDHIRPGRIGQVRLNVVDYQAISRDARWPVLIQALETAQVPGRRNERLAFWINTYNILAIRVVLSQYPVKSIKDGGTLFQEVWDKEAGQVAGKVRTLNEIEHKILRPMGEPRIHAAIVCASVSCPPLRAEAFRGEKLGEQLDDQMRTWIQNEDVGVKIEKGGSVLRISSIFKWFGEDFEKDGNSVRQTIDRYLTDAQKSRIQADASISYASYDWTLNDAKRSK